MMSRRHQLFEERCGYSHIQSPFPRGCDRNTKNVEIATRLSRVVMHVLSDVPPSVPLRRAPLASVLACRELKPKLEFERLNGLRMRRARPVYSEEDDEKIFEEESFA